MGLFTGKGVSTTTIVVEEKDGVLSLLPTKRRGEGGSVSKHDSRVVRSFAIPHIPHDDIILAEDIQNKRVFGSEDQLESVSQIVNDRLQIMRGDHEVTHEHFRIGALQGKILDADGSTVLFNLFTEFNVSEQTTNFEFTSGSIDPQSLVVTVVRAIEDELGAAAYDHIHVFCGKDWFDAFVKHGVVKTAYERWRQGEFLRTDLRKGFEFAGVLFEEYRGKIGSVSFIGDTVARAFPVGVPNMYVEHWGPGDFMETVNTIGLPVYAKQEMMDFNRGVRLHTQSNVLPIVTRPKALHKLTKS